MNECDLFPHPAPLVSGYFKCEEVGSDESYIWLVMRKNGGGGPFTHHRRKHFQTLKNNLTMPHSIRIYLPLGPLLSFLDIYSEEITN